MIKPANGDINPIEAIKIDMSGTSISNNAKWISANEELPTDGERVLVWYEYFRFGDTNSMYQTYGIGYQYEGRWSGDVQGIKARCLYWMTLPKPPIGD